ncbi:hypothetical protein C8R45DRAFT_1027338 [Mycena sanguinolenta]|nr:hypothetical protein C8R45DRAFT_1027338 [Mycena sanguinolenta]
MPHQAADKLTKRSFWTPWILLAKPLAWTYWGFIYGVVLLLAFIWRDGATNEPDDDSRLSPHQAYGPRLVESAMIIVALFYFVLIVLTARGIGLGRRRMDTEECIQLLDDARERSDN